MKMSIKTAADALAAAVKANIEACYGAQQALWSVEHNEQVPWSEEGLRRSAAHARAVAAVQTTHVACVDAVKDYEAAVRMEELVEQTRAFSKTMNEMETKMSGVFESIEQQLGLKPMPVTAPEEPPPVDANE